MPRHLLMTLPGLTASATLLPSAAAIMPKQRTSNDEVFFFFNILPPDRPPFLRCTGPPLACKCEGNPDYVSLGPLFSRIHTRNALVYVFFFLFSLLIVPFPS